MSHSVPLFIQALQQCPPPPSERGRERERKKIERERERESARVLFSENKKFGTSTLQDGVPLPTATSPRPRWQQRQRQQNQGLVLGLLLAAVEVKLQLHQHQCQQNCCSSLKNQGRWAFQGCWSSATLRHHRGRQRRPLLRLRQLVFFLKKREKKENK